MKVTIFNDDEQISNSEVTTGTIFVVRDVDGCLFSMMLIEHCDELTGSTLNLFNLINSNVVNVNKCLEEYYGSYDFTICTSLETIKLYFSIVSMDIVKIIPASKVELRINK